MAPSTVDRQALVAAGFPVDKPLWITWEAREGRKGKKAAKVPQPPGVVNKPELWKPLAELPEGAPVGLIIAAPDADLTCIDIDNIPSIRDPEQQELVRELTAFSYCVTESYSGRGLHLWFNWAWDFEGNFYTSKGLTIEVYSRHSEGRFIAETGKIWHYRGKLPRKEERPDLPGFLKDKGFKPGGLPGAVIKAPKAPEQEDIKAPSWRDLELEDEAEGVLEAEPGQPLEVMGQRCPSPSEGRLLLLKLAVKRGCPSLDELFRWGWACFKGYYLGRSTLCSDRCMKDAAKAWASTAKPEDLEAPATTLPEDDAWAELPDTPPPAVENVSRETDDSDNTPQGDTNHAALASLFVHSRQGTVRYVDGRKAWYHFDPATGSWQQDTRRQFERFMREFLEREADRLTAGLRSARRRASTREKLLGYWNLNGVLNLVRSFPSVATDQDDFDRDPWLLGTPSGVVDLRTGVLRPGRLEDMVSLRTTVAPAGGEPVEFLRFLNEVMAPDEKNPDKPEQLVPFLQEYLGMCLTGDVSMQKLLFLFGEGGNGKSCLMRIVELLLGDYYGVVSSEVLMKQKYKREEIDNAKFLGKRVVVASEIEEGAVWDEQHMKMLTGGDKLPGRFLYGNSFNFDPTHKLLMLGNHKPQFTDMSVANMRRLLLVEFRREFLGAKEVPKLAEKLVALEGPQILGWFIQGCLRWQARGRLEIPAIVTADTMAYMQREDAVLEFLNEQTVKQPDAWMPRTALYLAFVEWWRKNQVGECWAPRRFYEKMESKGHHGDHKKVGIRGFKGLALVAPPIEGATVGANGHDLDKVWDGLGTDQRKAN